MGELHYITVHRVLDKRYVKIYIFIFLSESICGGYLLEVPRRDTSDE